MVEGQIWQKLGSNTAATWTTAA